jgi:biopolymer transport protein ExbB
MEKATKAKGFDVTKVIDAFGYVIYGTLAILAIWGVYNCVLLYRNLNKKGLKNQEAANLIGQVRDLTMKGNYQGAIDLCTGPPTGTPPWHS